MILIHQAKKDTLCYSCNICSFPVFLLDTENGPSYLNAGARHTTIPTPKTFPFVISRLTLPVSLSVSRSQPAVCM